jgi:hypothetical protein
MIILPRFHLPDPLSALVCEADFMNARLTSLQYHCRKKWLGDIMR